MPVNHEEIERVVKSKIKEPTIVNPESRFVVITYWWGKIQNKNIARPCPVFFENFVNGTIENTLLYMDFLTSGKDIKVDFGQNFMALYTNPKEFSKLAVQFERIKKVINFAKEDYLNSIYSYLSDPAINKDELNFTTQNKEHRFTNAKKVLKDQNLSPSEFKIIYDSVSEEVTLLAIEEFLVEIAKIVIEYSLDYVTGLLDIKKFYEDYKKSHKESTLDKKALNSMTKQIQKTLKEKKDNLHKDVMNKIAEKKTYHISGVKYEQNNIYDILNTKLRFIKSIDMPTMIDRWEKSCASKTCNYLSIEYPEFTQKGGYQMAINAKPNFIRHALTLCSGRSVLYIDGDMIMHRYPHIFDMQNVDFMSTGWNIDPRMNGEYNNSVMVDPYKFETSGGIMFFANTNNSNNLLEVWIEESKSPSNDGKADDRILSLIFVTKKMMFSVNLIQLPIEYLWLTLKYDEWMLEEYDWDYNEMYSSMFVEHPECLTSEETARNSGAASSREPVFYSIVENTYSPKVEEELFEYFMFGDDKNLQKSIKSYIDFMEKIKYLDDGDINSDYIGKHPLVVIPQSEKFGYRQRYVTENEAKMVKIMNSDKHKNVLDKIMLNDLHSSPIIKAKIIREDELNGLSEIPFICYLLDLNYKVIFIPTGCKEVQQHIEEILKTPGVNSNELVFFPDILSENMVDLFHPVIHKNKPVYFNKDVNDGSLLITALKMFSSLSDMSQYFSHGGYYIKSRINIGFAKHKKSKSFMSLLFRGGGNIKQKESEMNEYYNFQTRFHRNDNISYAIQALDLHGISTPNKHSTSRRRRSHSVGTRRSTSLPPSQKFSSKKRESKRRTSKLSQSPK